ncbi:MAG: hypothetical protein M3Z21_09880 [Pseudomonadota bacterium]|nr:hypothetical protein [Pseudomonadota bacterium]
MSTDDFLNSINKAVVTTELFDVVAAGLRDAGIDDPWESWERIAARLEAKRPDLARALRCADARWRGMSRRG